MKKILLLFAMCYSMALHSQTNPGKLTGRIIDSASRKPMDYVTINIKDSTGKVYRSALSSADGSFILADLKIGDYKLLILSVGYSIKILPIKMTAEKPYTDLGLIPLSAKQQGLKEVVITADKPVIKQEVDRLVYDLQADPESKTNNVLEMMRKVPMVSVDADENIQLKGSQSYRILIDGKPSSLLESNPKDILRSMPASTIKSIEVMTTPPSKYDGEGLAGIINIVTNKTQANGLKGSVNFSQRMPYGPSIGSNISLKQGKFGLSAFGGAKIYNSPETGNSNLRTGTNQTFLNQSGLGNSDSRTIYGGTELSFEIDTLNLISGQFSLNGRRSESSASQNSTLVSGNSILQGYRLVNDGDAGGDGFDAAVNYQLGFKSSKKRFLTFSYKYYSYADSRNDIIKFSDQISYNNPGYQQDNNSRFSEQTIQVDYVHPLKKIMVEAGIKGIRRDNKSDFNYLIFDLNSGEYSQVNGMSNNFTNTQSVYGVYNTYQYSAKNWNIKAGARLEQTLIDANFISTASLVKQNYLTLMPSLAMSYTLKNKSSFNLGYTRRLQRPGIWSLNPFVDRTNPNLEYSGNAQIQPSYSDMIDFGFTRSKKGSLRVGLSLISFSGLIFQVSSFDQSTGITRTRPENVGNGFLIGSNISMNYPITKKWNFNFNSNVARGEATGMNNGIRIHNQGLMYNLAASTSYKLEKGWRLNANGGLNGGSLTIQQNSNAFVSSSFSVNKDVVKDKFSVSVSANNPFNKYRYNKVHSFGPGFDQNSNNQIYYRQISVGINYNFGKLKDEIRKAKRGINNDDISGGSNQ